MSKELNRKELTASNLRNVLWDTLNGLKDGTVQPDIANAVAGQAREIVRTVKVQIQVASQCNRELSASVTNFTEK